MQDDKLFVYPAETIRPPCGAGRQSAVSAFSNLAGIGRIRVS